MFDRRQIGRGLFRHADHGARRRGQDTQQIADGQRRGTDAGQRVGRAAAKHRRHGKATTYRHITAGAGDRLADAQRVAIGQGHGLMRRHPPLAAIGRPHGQRRIGTGHGQHGLALALQLQTAADGFQRGDVAAIADQTVGHPQCGLVQCARGRHALPGLAGAAEVLEYGLQSGALDLQRRGASAFALRALQALRALRP